MKIGSIPISEELKLLRTGGSSAPLERPLDIEQDGGPEKLSFSEFLSQQFNAANSAGVEAERALERAVLGEEVNPHATIIAVQKASVSLTLMMTIKERLERAYQELIRTPLG